MPKMPLVEPVNGGLEEEVPVVLPTMSFFEEAKRAIHQDVTRAQVNKGMQAIV